MGREYELQDVLEDLGARLTRIEDVCGREHDDRLAEIEAVAGPYALAFYYEILRLEKLIPRTRTHRASRRNAHGGKPDFNQGPR